MQRFLTKRERIIVFITAGVIIFALFFNFLIFPHLIKYDNLNKEIKLNQTKLKKYLRLLSQRDYIQSKYSKFTATPKMMEVHHDGLVGILSELEDLAKNSNIRIIDLRPQASKTRELYPEILIDLRTEGSMQGYLKFIYDLENSLLLLRIKKFQLSSQPSASNLEATFSISQIWSD